jgi:hypothetical protein
MCPLQARVAYALATSSTYIATACNAGIVRLFSLRTLAFKANLPRIAPRGQDQSHSKAAAGQDIFPDAIACSFDASGKCLVVAYSDRSLHIWDVSDMSQVGHWHWHCLDSSAGLTSAFRLQPRRVSHLLFI